METPDYAKNTNFIIQNGNVKVLKENGMIKTWKNRYMTICVSSSLGLSCIIKYKDKKEFVANRGKYIYNLSDISQAQQDIKDKSCIDIRIKDSTTLTLKFEKVNESTRWLQTIIDTKQNDASRSPPFVYTSYVKLLESNTRMGFLGECCLMIDKEYVRLKSHNGVQILAWLYKVIRNFTPAADNKTFSIEVGRASQTGEGLFTFSSFQTKEIISQLVSCIIVPGTSSTQRSSLSSTSKSSKAPPGMYLTTVHLK